jgi:hypothetical protein
MEQVEKDAGISREQFDSYYMGTNKLTVFIFEQVGGYQFQ